ncbi:hypothetical protein [Corynebacterium terpenotabidum]|nr:hypothetical protein [Corynebacterium terpenotabidum]
MHLKHLSGPAVALSTVALVATLSACSDNNEDDSSVVVTVTSEVTTTPATTTARAGASMTATADSRATEEPGTDGTGGDNGLPAPFSTALDNVDGAYQYSLMDLTGDGEPELLLREESDGIGTITVFTSDGTAVPTTLQDGPGGPDGATYSVAATSDQTGLLTTETPAGLDTTTTVRWELSGGYLQRTSDSWTYIGGLVPLDLAARTQEISWTDGTTD